MTLRAAYEGDSVDALIRLNEDATAHTFNFEAVAGTTYRLALYRVGSYQTDSFTLDLHQASPPANDNFADAEALRGFSATTQGTLAESS